MHFTYAEPDCSRLRQGDLIRRTDEIAEILKAYHPYFAQHPSYNYFSILTQSCDLVLRDGSCAARYVVLAVVRPISEIFLRKLEDILAPLEYRLGFAGDHVRTAMEQFSERLLNNNEPGNFFYRQDIDLGLAEDCVAVLNLSIAVKTSDYYMQFANAKVLELTDSFQHKLGFLVGNSYSRVGTEDWVPRWRSDSEFSQMVKDLMKNVEIAFLPRKDREFVRKELEKLPEEQRTQEAMQLILEQRLAKKHEEQERVFAAMQRHMVEVGLEDGASKKLMNRLRSDPAVAAAVGRI